MVLQTASVVIARAASGRCRLRHRLASVATRDRIIGSSRCSTWSYPDR